MVRVHAVHAGGERVDRATFDPFDAEVGTQVLMPYFFFVIEHPEGVVLFDSGAHRAFIDDPAKLGPMADAWQIEMQPGDDVVSKLQVLGFDPAEFKHVAHSHLHYDHIGGAGLFPNAAFYIQRRELGFAFNPPPFQADIYVPWTFNEVTNWAVIEGSHDMFGDGRVVLFPTPGHTPGHQSMLVKLGARTLILCADAAYNLEKMRQRALPAVHWSAEETLRSWELIELLERQHDAELLICHELEWETKMKVGPGEYYE